MIQQVKESGAPALWFKAVGKLTPLDVAELSTLIEEAIAAHKRPIGILADLSEMHGASWAARWDEMRFLQRHSDRIARLAVVCTDEWQEVSEMVLIAASFMQAETVYCPPADILHAWHWVKMQAKDAPLQLRPMYPGKGLFEDYTPEYVGL